MASFSVSTNFRNRSSILLFFLATRCKNNGVIRSAVTPLSRFVRVTVRIFAIFPSPPVRKIAIKRLTETMPSPDNFIHSLYVLSFFPLFRPVDAEDGIRFLPSIHLSTFLSIRIESIGRLETVLCVIRFNEWKITRVLRSFFFFF